MDLFDREFVVLSNYNLIKLAAKIREVTGKVYVYDSIGYFDNSDAVVVGGIRLQAERECLWRS